MKKTNKTYVAILLIAVLSGVLFYYYQGLAKPNGNGDGDGDDDGDGDGDGTPSSNVRALSTWAYKFSSQNQVNTFVQAAKTAGYNWIFCFNGYLYNDNYPGSELYGGICISTSDAYLVTQHKSDSGNWILQAAHAAGLKVAAFESVEDVYGFQGSHSVQCYLSSSYHYIVKEWDANWQTYWRHYASALKNAGFDALMFDEYGSEYSLIPSESYASQSQGYLSLFGVGAQSFGASNVFISVVPDFNNPISNYQSCRQLGYRFSPWTVQSQPGATSYPLPSAIVGSDMVVWMYPRNSLGQPIGSFHSVSSCRQMATDAKSKGAVGASYWVALPGDEGSAYFSGYADLLKEVFP